MSVVPSGSLLGTGGGAEQPPAAAHPAQAPHVPQKRVETLHSPPTVNRGLPRRHVLRFGGSGQRLVPRISREVRICPCLEEP